MELNCQIQDKIERNQKYYYLVKSNDDPQSYIIPVSQLQDYAISIGESYIFKKTYNRNSNKYFLEYLYKNKNQTSHDYYKIGEKYDFEVVEFTSLVGKNDAELRFILLRDIKSNLISVKALKWQTELLWKYPTLTCCIERFTSDGVPIVINQDFRHSIYRIGSEYEFKVIGERVKEFNGVKYDIFDLLGEDGCNHQVNKLPGQQLLDFDETLMNCQVVGITTHLRLSQGKNTKDPFFASYREIVDDREVENKYFLWYFSNNSLTYYEQQLVEQYNSQSAFWVFTYTNRILPKLFNERVSQQDYGSSKIINLLIVKFEEWIINKGIIKSFPDEEIRITTIFKARTQLKSAKLIDEVLSTLISNPHYFLIDDSLFLNHQNIIERVYYLASFTNPKILNSYQFLSRLKSLLEIVKSLSEADRMYLEKLLKFIRNTKKTFLSDEEKQYFSLASIQLAAVYFSEKEQNFVNWTYCEILISKALSQYERVNILVGQLLKLYTKSVTEVSKKESLLFEAYWYFDNLNNTFINSPFVLGDVNLLLDFDLLTNAPALDEQNNQLWVELEEKCKNKQIIEVHLSKRSKTGYETFFNGLSGFLPYHQIKERKLKSYQFEECDFVIKARILIISAAFKFYIIEQVEDVIEGVRYNLPFEQGKIYDAVIKNVVEFGVFVTTKSGEGLLHIKDIFDFRWNANNIFDYFKVGQKINVYCDDCSDPEKVSFSFKKVKDFDILYYSTYIETLFSNKTNFKIDETEEYEQPSNFDLALFEKAFCIEQYAVLQFEIEFKIQNLQIAKQFYTNAQNARSFLLNIYISYFEVLNAIKNILAENSLTGIARIKESAKDISSKINKRTLEAFPDADKLIFFLNIISLFNDKTESSLDVLYNYVKQYDSIKHKDLKTIAKITLANNLLISETKQDSEFPLKNLRLLFNYLSNGTLTLDEAIEDKNRRQLQEDLLYWSEKIKEDEGETLEFKSSFFTPLLDESQIRRLAILTDIDKRTDLITQEISRINGDLAKKAIIHSALKTVVAFANHKGGTLLLGVTDSKAIIGLEQEYLTFKKKDRNRDGFGKYFDQMVKNYIGDSFSSLMNRKFLKFAEGDILVITITPSNHEVFLLLNEEGKPEEQLYIRNLSSSKELKGSELSKFIRNKHLGMINTTVEEVG